MSAPSDSAPHGTGPSVEPLQVRHVLEACLLVAGRAMSVAQLQALFADEEDAEVRPPRADILAALVALQSDYDGRGIELVEVASGWRLQSRSAMEPWVARLFQERPPRYSRALLETLVLVAYRQPITRGEIEEVRGVAVSSSIVRTLQEREWVREVGHKEVPGRPALLGTTRQFLDYFNLKRLEDLPPLGELKDLDSFDPGLDSAPGSDPDPDPDAAPDAGSDAGPDADAGTGAVPGDVGALGNAAVGTAANDAEGQGEMDAGPADERKAPDATAVPEAGPEPSHGNGPDASGPASGQAWEDPRERLRRVIDRFAAEHREDLLDQGRGLDDSTVVPAEERRGSAAGGPRRDDDVP